MIKEAFGTGATTQAAVDAAKAELNAPWDADVQVEILEAPKKKTFGLFGGSPAKARAYYEVPDEVKSIPDKQISTGNKENKKKSEFTFKKKQAPAEDKTADEDKKSAQRRAPVTPVGEKTEASEKAAAYLSSVIESMGVSDYEIDSAENSEGIEIGLTCEKDYGYIIGRRGETLDALQYLTRLVVNKGKDSYKRVSINAGNYREKREDTLRELAKKSAAKVKKYGRNVCLDPMNPYERRIIHTTVQEIEGVNSHSIGSESDRRVVISLADGYKASNPGYGRGRRNDSRGRRGYSSVNTEPPADRAPISDAASASLYGRIETGNKEE